jgi:hypothetical protein
MKKIVNIIFFAFFAICSCTSVAAQTTDPAALKIVFIRHAEKPLKGDNLTCQGFNRSVMLPKLLMKKFGLPTYIFVPSLGVGESTKHARMFQTIAPFAMKYNLAINTSHAEKDSLEMAADLKGKTGTILVVWEHKAIAPIIHSLGITATGLIWPDDDYDSIWIVTFNNGRAVLTKDKEGLSPSADCPL